MFHHIIVISLGEGACGSLSLALSEQLQKLKDFSMPFNIDVNA